MTSIASASSQQITKILEVLKRSMPRGAMIEQIIEETGYPSDIVWSALHSLERDGTIMGRNPFAYDPSAAAEDEDADTEDVKE